MIKNKNVCKKLCYEDHTLSTQTTFQMLVKQFARALSLPPCSDLIAAAGLFVHALTPSPTWLSLASKQIGCALTKEQNITFWILQITQLSSTFHDCRFQGNYCTVGFQDPSLSFVKTLY